MPNPNNRIKNARRKVGWPIRIPTPEELAKIAARHKVIDKAAEMYQKGISEEEVLKYLDDNR